MTPAVRFVVLGIAACAAAALWPITPAVPSSDVLLVRVSSAVMSAAACAILGAPSKALKPAHATALSAASSLAGVALLWWHFNAMVGCVADYNGRALVIGREFTKEAAAGYVRDNPGLSPADRLLDAGGDPARIWTIESIRTCRFLVTWGGPASVVLFTIGVGALVARGRRQIAPPPMVVKPVTLSSGTSVYDAFLSYRHSEPDRSHALEILESLEARGLRVAIDVRDFAPNEHFLSEMERCIKQSRFVLCVVTSQYLKSDHTSEEAIISKTLDMAERRKRLVPLIFEPVEVPVWLHGLVGIDFTPEATVEPLARLVGLLAEKRGAPRV
ncbi:MAG TPA: toll/interleukin-1 receptor domain-containing protein [Vicinamibacterales bacterium]|jgi:hypothetical protein